MNAETYLTKLQDEMRLKNYAPKSIRNYRSVVASFLGKYAAVNQPKDISEAEIKRYLLAIRDGGCSLSHLKQNIGAIKLFYK